MSTDTEVIVYIPPMWLYNRVIVRKKGTKGPEFVLRRLRCEASRKESSIEIIPLEGVSDRTEWDSVAVALSLEEIETNYESTGRTVSVTRLVL